MIREILQPNSLEEVKSYLDSYENVKLLAGGTDLIIDLNKNKVKADYLVNLNKVKELKEIKEEGHTLFLGSMITFTELKEARTIRSEVGLLADCADSMGSPQIRNTATIGGNISNSASAADIIPCIICLDGALHIESKKGKREVLAEDYFKNYSEEKLKENEVLTGVSFKKGKGYSGFYKLGKRNSLAISRINACVYIEVENNKVQNFKIALGAVGRYPFRLHELEKMVLNKDVEYLFNIEVLEYLENTVYESIKTRESMPFKKEAVKGVYKEAVARALKRGGINHE